MKFSVSPPCGDPTATILIRKLEEQSQDGLVSIDI